MSRQQKTSSKPKKSDEKSGAKIGAPAGPARRAVSKIEAKSMIEAWQARTCQRDRALFQVMYYTGLRVSEALSLKVHQVWDGCKVRPRVTVNARSTKGKRKAANIDLCQALHAALKPICNGRKGQEWLFRSEKQNQKPLSRY